MIPFGQARAWCTEGRDVLARHVGALSTARLVAAHQAKKEGVSVA